MQVLENELNTVNPFSDDFEKKISEEMGKKFQSARVEAGYTQKAIGIIIGKDERSISRLEHGAISSSVLEMLKYAYFYGKTDRLDIFMPDSLIEISSQSSLRSEDDKINSSCSDISESDEREQSISELLNKISSKNLSPEQIKKISGVIDVMF